MNQNYSPLTPPCEHCHIDPEHRDACHFRHCEKWRDWFSANWKESAHRLKISPRP